MTLFLDKKRSIDVPVQMIYDTDMSKKDLSNLFDAKEYPKSHLKKCGVKFHHLTTDQEKTIDRYFQQLKEILDTVNRKNKKPKGVSKTLFN